MPQFLSKAQRDFQKIKRSEKKARQLEEKMVRRAEKEDARVQEIFSMASALKKSASQSLLGEAVQFSTITDRQAQILVRVQRTLEQKRKKGLIK